MAKEFYSNAKTPDEKLSREIGNITGGVAASKTVSSKYIEDFKRYDLKNIKKIKILDPNEIRFSQASINDHKGVFKSMSKYGWKGEPIDVVRMPDGKLTAIDNTRLAAARHTKTPIKVNIREYDEPLKSSLEIERFTTSKGIPSTWGDAATLRIKKQNAAFRSNNPLGSDNMPIIKIKEFE